MSWSPPNEHSGKYFYHNIVIANLKKLRANYPRYSIRFFSLLALCGTFVASTCYQFIQIAKKQQLEYLNTVFKEDAFKDFKFEELDSYAMQNIIINILDNNPEIFHNKKQVLSYYVGLLTQNNTDPLYSRSWLPFSPLISVKSFQSSVSLVIQFSASIFIQRPGIKSGTMSKNQYFTWRLPILSRDQVSFFFAIVSLPDQR